MLFKEIYYFIISNFTHDCLKNALKDIVNIFIKGRFPELDNLNKKAKFICIENVDYRWNYLGLIVSILFLIFSTNFVPCLSVKESNENMNQQRKYFGYDISKTFKYIFLIALIDYLLWNCKQKIKYLNHQQN